MCVVIIIEPRTRGPPAPQPANGASSSSSSSSSTSTASSSMPSDPDEAWLNRLSVKELRAELRIHGVVTTDALV
jgi:hypothetical protein